MTDGSEEVSGARDGLLRQHRDTLFRGAFKIPKNFLQLLDKCSGGKFEFSESDIVPFDLESDAVVRLRRNDVSFITSDNRLLILIEHQSIMSRNIAFRLLLYYFELVQLWIKRHEINIYGNSPMPSLPAPEFYVAYHGPRALTEWLSAFRMEHERVKLGVEVEIVDIHFEMLEDQASDNALAGYAYFYKVFDEGVAGGLSRSDAFTRARDECMRLGYLEGFIEREDFEMSYKDILDYDTQLREEGREEGAKRAR